MCWKSLSVFSSCCYCLPKKKMWSSISSPEEFAIFDLLYRLLCGASERAREILWVCQKSLFEMSNDNTRHSTRARQFDTSNRAVSSRAANVETNESKERWRFDIFSLSKPSTLQIFDRLRSGWRRKKIRALESYHSRAQKHHGRRANVAIESRRMWKSISQPS